MGVFQGMRFAAFRHPIAWGRSFAASAGAGRALGEHGLELKGLPESRRLGNSFGTVDLIGLTSKVRWGGLVLGLVAALGMKPAPISVGGMLVLTALILPYNLLMAMTPRLPSSWRDTLALGSLVVDFGIISGAMLLRSNDPYSTMFVLLPLVGIEAAMFYMWKGAVISGAACVLALVAMQAVRNGLFGFPFDPGNLVFVALVILMSPSLAAGAIYLVRRQQRELGEAAESLDESESQLRAVLNSTAVGIARLGPEGTILDGNPALAAMLGMPKGELTGHSLEEFADSGDEPGGLKLHEELRRGTQSTIVRERRYHRRDGQTFWAQLTASLVDVADERPYCVVVVEDVTAQKNTQRARELAIAELERLGKLKSNFVSLVSHEFRTALVGIMGFADLIQSEDLPAEDVKELARDIVLDSTRLDRLITDMLDFEKMQVGRMPIWLTDIDLNEVVRKAVGRSIAASVKHSLRLDLDSHLPTLPADYDRLTQVMANLLSNAVKYSPAGGEIVVTSRRDGDSAHLTVQDHGVGIPADSLQKVFNRYSRLEDDATRHVGGTGLGLSIAKEIIALHGGRIWAASEPGHGATFHFTLPLSRPQATHAA